MKAEYIEKGVTITGEVIEYNDEPACCLVRFEKKKENSEEIEHDDFYIERSSLKILE